MKGYISARQTFYTNGIMEMKYLDRFLYRGKGRPRKTDFSPLKVIQKKLVKEHNDYLNNQLYPPIKHK